MKYLEKRDNYLKLVSERKELKKDELLNTGLTKIFENSPYPIPVIPWGDSLLGRLINSGLRKAQEGINTMKMSLLVKRIKSHFEYIIGMSSVNTLEDADRLLISRFQLISLFILLAKAVEEKKDTEEIIGLCQECIDGISTLKVGDALESEKDKLLDKLKAFKEFLEGLKSAKPTENTDMYPNYLNNFKVVLRMCQAYAVLKNSKNPNGDQKLTPGKEYNFTNKKGETKKVKLISLTNTTGIGADKKWLTPDDVKTSPLGKDSAFVAYPDQSGNYTGFNAGAVSLSQLKESIRLYENSTGPMNSLKSLYSFVVNPQGVDSDEIDRILKDTQLEKLDKYKTPITKIYTFIRKANNVSEDVNNLLTRPEEIGKKISELYLITKTKPDGGFDGVPLEMQVLIKEFNSTMVKCLSKDSDKKNESVIRSYSRFISLNEVTNPIDSLKNENISDKISEYFAENFDDEDYRVFEIWEVKDEEVKDMQEKLARVVKKSITIRGTGPILEIVRLFNRAYKIHTKNAIPFSGREGGKLNVGTMNRWTSFGGGGGSGEMKGKGEGPYRNHKLFNQWEDAIFDIFKEYELVFTSGTILIIDDMEKKDAGANLRAFMTEMLDGEELYKPDSGRDSGGGAQKKALDKYFGIVAETGKISETNPQGKPDIVENGENAGNIKESNMTFEKDQPVGTPSNTNGLVGSFFGLECKDKEGVSKVLYFYINLLETSILYLTCTHNPAFFQKYLATQNGPKMTIKEKDKYGKSFTGSGMEAYLIKINNSEFYNLKNGKKLTLNAINTKGEDKVLDYTIQGKPRYLAKEDSEKKEFNFYKISDTKSLNNGLDQAKGLFNDVVNKIKTLTEIK